MKKQEINGYNIPALLAKLLTGELSEEEKERLQAWKDESDANRQLCDEIMTGEYIRNKCRETAKVDIIGGYMKVIGKRKRNVQMRRLKRVVAVAAGILLPLLVTVLWVKVEDKGNMEPLTISEVIRHGEVKAELVLADGTTRLLGAGGHDSLLPLQGANIRVQERGVSYHADSAHLELQYNTLRVPRGGEYSVTLSDGSVVFLNSESELRFPVNFAGGERRVYLAGEAYFDVVKDSANPFVVDLSSSAIKVLGTSFNISAYADEDEVLTTLVQGSVAFMTRGKEMVLIPGEQAVMNRAGTVVKREVDMHLYTAWKDGVFAFRHQRLEEIMKIVSRWYDVEVFWENASQKQVTFTGKMRRYDDFSKVVQMLEMTGNTEFEVRGKTIFIRER